MFKVSVENVKVYPHPTGDNLELVAIGEQQYVVQKGLYNTGDKAVAVPKGALLTYPILLQEWNKYLQGADKNIVGFVILRGQESQGIVIREDILSQLGYNINDFEVGQDISNLLGISKYIPEIPDNLKDSVEVYSGPNLVRDIKHDCKYPTVYIDRFKDDELVTITSKLHGSQLNAILTELDKPAVISSKGLWDQGLVFKDTANNIYTKAWNNFVNNDHIASDFVEVLLKFIDKTKFSQIQIVGEVVFAIKGFSYGKTEPTLYLFAVYIDGVAVDLINFRSIPNINIVPELYRGPFNKQRTLEHANLFAEYPTCPLDGVTLNEGVVISNGRHYIKIKNERFMKKHGTNEAN